MITDPITIIEEDTIMVEDIAMAITIIMEEDFVMDIIIEIIIDIIMVEDIQQNEEDMDIIIIMSHLQIQTSQTANFSS